MKNALLCALHSQLCSTRGLAVCFVLSNSVCYSNSEANFLKWTSLFLAYTSSLLLWYFCFKDYQWLWLFETHPFKTLRIETGNRWNLVSWTGERAKKGDPAATAVTPLVTTAALWERKRRERSPVQFLSAPSHPQIWVGAAFWEIGTAPLNMKAQYCRACPPNSKAFRLCSQCGLKLRPA